MKNLFLEDYFSKLFEYHKTPKIQIERAISPLLTMFIKELIGEYLKNNYLSVGEIGVDIPEFPLKKKINKQSNNIDWMMVNKQLSWMIFVELKTSASSFNRNQLTNYKQLQSKIHSCSAQFLFTDIDLIKTRSSEKNKYEFILKAVSKSRKEIEMIRNSMLIYIVPSSLKKALKDERVILFSEFPEEINHTYADEWKQLRSFLISIDSMEKGITPRIHSNEEFIKALQFKITEIEESMNRTSELIWFGNSGSGFNPNFQIQFTDGTSNAFFASGKVYSRKKTFNQNRIRGPYKIKEVLSGAVKVVEDEL